MVICKKRSEFLGNFVEFRGFFAKRHKKEFFVKKM
jgi:hypothetical protein